MTFRARPLCSTRYTNMAVERGEVRFPRYEVWHEDHGIPQKVVERTHSEESAYLCAILHTLRANSYSSYTVHAAGSLEAKRQMDEAKKTFNRYGGRY